MPHNWKEYAKNTKHRTAHHLLMAALNFLKLQPKKVKNMPLKTVDLGCGTGGDTLYLLQEGCEVIAVDNEKQAITIVKERIETDLSIKSSLSCSLIKSPMQKIKLLEQQDLITSNLALPFVSPRSFSLLWAKIVQNLRFGGIFSGQFFGKQHKWSDNIDMTFHNVRDFENLFKGLFKIIHSFEERAEHQTVFQGMQFWHQYDVIAIRILLSPERPLLTQCILNSQFRELQEKSSTMTLESKEDRNGTKSRRKSTG